MLWLGTQPGSNGKSFQGIAKRTLENVHRGTCKLDVFDPVLGNGCCNPLDKNITWHPIKTATNGALALGMIRWMMENDANDTVYLSFPNQKAAVAGGYASYTSASYLVIDDEGHPNFRKMMRPADAGLEEPEADPKATTKPTYYVVVDPSTGQPAVHTQATAGDIEFEGEVNGIKVRASYLFLKDEAFANTLDEYAEITGVPADTIANVAREFASHGVKSSAAGLGSTANATGVNGLAAYLFLNAMVGSNQMVGGTMSRRVSAKTSADGTQYKLATVKGKPGVSAKNATYISRTGKTFDKTDEYKNRVAAGEKDPKARLPWYSHPSGSDNQALVSAAMAYPYQAKILVSWMTDTLQASSGAMRDAIIDRLKDPAIIPLHIACDVVVGEHASLADYLVPDTNPFESFGVVTQEGYWKGKGNAVRWPAKTPETVQLDDGRYASYEAFIVDVAKECGVPGFGEDAIEGADGKMWPLNDACDFFLKAVANLAYDTEPVADVSGEDVKVQALDELPAAWEKAVTAEEWPKVLNVLSRGGRFWPVEESTGEGGRSAYMKDHLTIFYSERKATDANPFSGKQLPGTLSATPELLADLTPLAEKYPESEWPFRSTNYKPRFRSITFLANSPIMRDLCAHNYLELNLDDAADLGIEDGDAIRITNPTGDVMEGEAMVRAGIARGTFGVAYGYGHIGYGAQDVMIEDGESRPGDPAIGAGVHLQTILDPTVEDPYPYVDPEAASPARSGGVYKIEKA